MKYRIELSLIAHDDLAKFKKSGDTVILKNIVALLKELEEHPETGTGKPEQLKKNLLGCWSRRITDKHRLIYRIEHEQITVVILRFYGHYDDNK